MDLHLVVHVVAWVIVVGLAWAALFLSIGSYAWIAVAILAYYGACRFFAWIGR